MGQRTRDMEQHELSQSLSPVQSSIFQSRITSCRINGSQMIESQEYVTKKEKKEKEKGKHPFSSHTREHEILSPLFPPQPFLSFIGTTIFQLVDFAILAPTLSYRPCVEYSLSSGRMHVYQSGRQQRESTEENPARTRTPDI